jgi:hypothetical protein
MYSGIYNHKHQILVANFPDFENIRKINSGYYDKDILCSDCDNKIISNLETYASKVLFHGIKGSKDEFIFQDTIIYDGLVVRIVDNIDYKRFKLFLLSLLWRSSVSKNPYFADVSLGKHEEILRQAILNGDPLDESDYRSFILIVKKNDVLPRDFILNPIKIKQLSDPSFCFYLNGAFYFFTTESNPALEIYYHGAIKRNNRLEIPIIEIEFVKNLLGRIWDVWLK